MAACYLTRVVTFSATHRLARAEWTAEQNRAAFGDVAKEHGHDYRCEVTIRGTLDVNLGMVMDLAALDVILHEEVVARFSNRAIHEIEPYSAGALPTGEMLCLDIWQRVAPRLPAGCTCACVRVAEDETLWSEYRGEEGAEVTEGRRAEGRR